MKKLNGREMKALFVLSIIVPVSLLVTLRLTGILEGPITITETTTLEAVKWEFQRPTHASDINDKLNITYTVDEFSANMHVLPVFYSESPVMDDNDYLRIITVVNSTAINSNCFIETVHVAFDKDSQPSLVSWIPGYLDFENLSLVGVSSGWTSGEDYKEAYVKLAGEGHPKGIYFRATVEWSLLTSNNQTHQMEVTYELTYYNGTAYKKVIQPFQLRIVGG